MFQPEISFIIPAYNEEKLLPKLLKSIKRFTPKILPVEVIVADNGSQDNTLKVANAYGATVVVNESATVGGLRNLAVQAAKGRVLVFLDADILLTAAWGEQITNVHQSLLDDSWQITGSKVGLSEEPGWIEEFWFDPLLRKKVNYINSGHMITTLELFNYLGGFDETLESGEDYAFSQSAIAVKAKITNNHLLAVTHEGYPKTLLEFIRREIWHGRGDCGSFHALIRSKVLIVAILLVFLHLFSALSILVFSNWRLGIAGLSVIAGICVSAALLKHGSRSFKGLVIVSGLYYVYFLSRFLSCISTVKGQH
jgi:glycosyltransferase involved in cell wall biosynthesis